METFIFEKTSQIARFKAELEKKLDVSITVQGKKVIIDGPALNEYEASIILDAINFGFSPKRALVLQEEGMIFVKMPIKNFTKRKNLKEVRARLIGKEGKTKRTIENITNCDVVINNNEVGFIGEAEDIEETKTAIQKLIKGSKEANVYKFLERMNSDKKNRI